MAKVKIEFDLDKKDRKSYNLSKRWVNEKKMYGKICIYI